MPISIQRTIVGNLAEDPSVEQAGKATVTRLRVMENTGEFRNGEYQDHETPTSHDVQAWFDLGTNAANSLHKGDRVIIVGREQTDGYEKDGRTVYRRVLRADYIAADLAYATAVITKIPRS